MPYFKNTICFFNFYYVSLNNFFLTIAYAINTCLLYTSGIRMQVNMHTDFDNKEVADLIQEKTVDTVSAKVQTGDNPQVAVIKTPPVDETVKTEIFNALKDKYNLSDDDLLSVSSASASFGNEIQRKALLYTLLAIICILIYIAIRFEWRSAIIDVYKRQV